MSIFSRLKQRRRPAELSDALITDAVGGAQWIADALASSGYRADFSVESLREVDRFFNEQTTQ